MKERKQNIVARDVFGVANNNRKNWQDFSTCCLDVSLFNRYQKETYLLSTLEWLNERFDKCIVNLGDTLHRHNLLHEYNTIEAAHQKARQFGDEWILENKPLLKTLTISCDIVRNDSWLAHDDFHDVHNALWTLYESSPTFREIVDNDIETFVSRQKDKAPEIVKKASMAYLLEETAADIILGKQGGVAHLYPGSRFDCYWYLSDNAQYIPSVLRGLENSAFKRISPSHIMRSCKGSRTHKPAA